jgi:hypothetical protein
VGERWEREEGYRGGRDKGIEGGGREREGKGDKGGEREGRVEEGGDREGVGVRV